MSTFDRLTNLARGVLSDGQKRFDAGGGLSGVARRAGEQARSAAETAREAVEEGLSGLSAPPPAEDPAMAAAREEVEHLRASPRAAVPPSAGRSAVRPAPDSISSKLEGLDRQLRSGAIDKATWEAERAVLLDALDRTSAARTPRTRTL